MEGLRLESAHRFAEKKSAKTQCTQTVCMSVKVAAFVVVGLFFGDEGKGATVDFLARSQNAGLVVRYNGGPQAAHHVVLEDGLNACFYQ